MSLNGKDDLSKSIKAFFQSKLKLTFLGLSLLVLIIGIFGFYYAYNSSQDKKEEAKASAIYTCPSGFTGPNASNQCTRAATPTCPANYTLTSGQCRISYTPTFNCPSGYSGTGGSCTGTATFQGCPSGYTQVAQFNGSFGCFACGAGSPNLYVDRSVPNVISYRCYQSSSCFPPAPSTGQCAINPNPAMSANANYRCPNGTIQGFDTCSTSASVSCPQGGSFSFGACVNNIPPSTYTCAQGSLSGSGASSICTTPATISDYTVVTDSDIATVSCTPVVGVLGYTVSCSVTTTSPVKGNVTFSTGTPGTGTCIATFTPGTTSANCSFPTTNPGLFPVTVTSSGGGTRTIPSITVQCAANSYLSGTSCTPCPTGATSVAGSTSLSQCTCPTGFVLNSGSTACIPASCPNGAINPLDTPPCTICPAGYELQGGQCKLIITILDISPSYDCIESKTVVIGTVYTCNFNVSGSGVLPSSGVIARTEKGGIVSSPNLPAECTLNSSVNPQVLTCTNIKTDNGLTPGLGDVALKVGSAGTFTDKGDVSLVRFANASDLDKAISCTPDTTLVNTTVTCSGKLDPHLIIENLTVKVTTSGTAATCVTTGALINGLDINCQPANVGPVPGLLDILASTTGVGVVNNAKVDDVNVTPLLSDTLLIEANKFSYSPGIASPVKFGDQPLILTLKGDSRFTSNGVSSNLTAVCKFKIKVFGANNSDAVNGFSITQAKLGITSTNSLGQAIPANLRGVYDQTSQSYSVPYDVNSGCSIVLPAQNQNQPKWEFDIRVERSDGQLFGSPEAYFMLYGAIGVVAISAS